MTISNQARESKISRDIPHLINFGCTSIIILIRKEIKFFLNQKEGLGEIRARLCLEKMVVDSS